MKQDAQIKNLVDVLENLKKALRWLRRSFESCSGIIDISLCNDEPNDNSDFEKRFQWLSSVERVVVENGRLLYEYKI